MIEPSGIDTAGLLGALLGELGDLPAWALGAARLLPVVLLVPAFGLMALALPVRVALAFALSLVVLPSASPALGAGGPFALAFALEFLRGVPLALTSASILWVATMAGGLVDNLRGARESASLPVLDEPAGPLGALLSLLAALAFLLSGGAARVAAAAAALPPPSASAFQGAAFELTRAIELAVAVAAPLVAVSIVVELAAALVTRAAAPAHVQALVAPLRSMALLAAAALLIERVVALLAELSASVPR